MNLFDVGMFEDVNYLLSETGQTVQINHFPEKTPARIAHMADKIIYDNMSHFADKMIYVQHFMRRGHYILFDGQTWIQLHEINQPRYNTYLKGAIRQCNECFRIIREYNDKQRFFSIPAVGIGATDVPTVVGGQFRLAENKLTVIVPDNTVTRPTKPNERFIMFDSAWKILSIDRTKRGILVMDCEPDNIRDTTDDVELGIADRYVESKDVLGGNTTPIPFDEMMKETYIESLDMPPVCGDGGGGEEPEPEPEPTDPIGIDGYDGIIKGTEEWFNAVIDGTKTPFPNEVEWTVHTESSYITSELMNDGKTIVVTVDSKYNGQLYFMLEVQEVGNPENKKEMKVSISKW